MLQVSELHNQAKTRLQEVSGNPKKLVLIHTAIALGSSLLLTFITYLLSLLIDETGGLRGLTARSLLTTAQSVLELAVMVAMPFWQVGIFYAALQWTRKELADFGSLLQGFRRFGPVLGLQILRGILFIALGMPLSYIATAIFMLTPLAAPFLERIAPMMEQGITSEQLETMVTPEFTAATMQAMIPLLIIFAIVYLAVAIPVFYRIRFADFAVMDNMPAGRAMVNSFNITKGSCLQVLKIDLSFWWFYLLQILSVAICYADSLLPALGVTLPVSGVTAAFLFYILGTVCQGVLLWQYEARRVTVYGLAYRTLDGTMDSHDMDAEV